MIGIDSVAFAWLILLSDDCNQPRGYADFTEMKVQVNEKKTTVIREFKFLVSN